MWLYLATQLASIRNPQPQCCLSSFPKSFSVNFSSKLVFMPWWKMIAKMEKRFEMKVTIIGKIIGESNCFSCQTGDEQIIRNLLLKYDYQSWHHKTWKIKIMALLGLNMSGHPGPTRVFKCKSGLSLSKCGYLIQETLHH